MMMWKDRYAIGVERIDEQHKELFDRLGSFIQVTNQKGDWSDRLEKAKETMNFLGDYVNYHFADEEELCRELGFPEQEEHKKAHQEFKKGIETYVLKASENSFDEATMQEFAGKLMTWLIVHVGKEDQKIGEYVKREGGGA